MTTALEDLKKYRDAHLSNGQFFREEHDRHIASAKEALSISCDNYRIAQEADDMLAQLGEVKRWSDDG